VGSLGGIMKYFSKILGVTCVVLLLFGCASPKSNDDKLTIWHWMNDRQIAFCALADKYEEETGIEVEFKLFSPPDLYSQKVIAAARAGRLPDIFGILGEKKTLASFIKADYILDLTPYMKEDASEWKNSFYAQALDVTSFDKENKYTVNNGIYGVPIDITIMEFLYNKELFKKAGFDPESPPETFDQFIKFSKAISEKLGVYGFVCGWGEGWLLNALAVEWAINLMGEEKFLKTIKGEVPYTDPQWIEVFSFFCKMKKSETLASNITTMINKESEDLFSKEMAAFSFNGSWAVNVYKQLNPNLKYAFFALPKISADFPVKIWGGAGSSFMVNPDSSKKEKAVKFLRWLTNLKQQTFLASETNNLPAVKGCENSLSEILTSLTKDLDILTHPNTWPDNEDSRVIEVMNKGLQQIVMDLKTPQEVAKEIQDAKERILIKK